MATVTDVIESFRRCQQDPHFYDRFYDQLFDRRPDVAEMFVEVDVPTRRAMVRKAVTTLLVRAGGLPGGNDTLERVRVSHGAGGLGVTDGQYGAWIDCLVETVATADPRFNADLDETWRRTLRTGVAYLIN